MFAEVFIASLAEDCSSAFLKTVGCVLALLERKPGTWTFCGPWEGGCVTWASFTRPDEHMSTLYLVRLHSRFRDFTVVDICKAFME